MRRRKKKESWGSVIKLVDKRLQDGHIKEGKTYIVRVPIKRSGRLDINRATLQEETTHEHTDQLP